MPLSTESIIAIVGAILALPPCLIFARNLVQQYTTARRRRRRQRSQYRTTRGNPGTRDGAVAPATTYPFLALHGVPPSFSHMHQDELHGHNAELYGRQQHGYVSLFSLASWIQRLARRHAVQLAFEGEHDGPYELDVEAAYNLPHHGQYLSNQVGNPICPMPRRLDDSYPRQPLHATLQSQQTITTDARYLFFGGHS